MTLPLAVTSFAFHNYWEKSSLTLPHVPPGGNPIRRTRLVRIELLDWRMARILYLMVQVPPVSKMNLFKICKAAMTGASPSSLSARAMQGNDPRYVHLFRWLVPQLRQWCRNRTFPSPALLATGLPPWSPIHRHFHLLPVTLLLLFLSCSRIPQGKKEVLLFTDLFKLPWWLQR